MRRLPARHSRARAGMVLVYLSVALVVVMGFVSLAVDLGRVQAAKTALEQIASAVARAAAAGISVSVAQAQNNASSIGSANVADGSPVTVDVNNDIQFGWWNTSTRTFTTYTGAARSNANAVQVSVARTTAKGNAVPLAFAQALGKSTCDVHGQATALIVYGWAVAGQSSVTMSGSAFVDSYNSTNGSYAAAHADHFASVASNGNITLNNTAVVNGDARPGVGKSVTVNNTASVTGVKAPLTAALSNPAFTLPGSGYTDLGDVSVSSGTFSLPGGTYKVNNCTLSGNSVFDFSGPLVVYVTGSLTITGTVTFNVASNLPTNFHMNVSGGGAVNLSNTLPTYIDLYAPQSAVTITNDGEIYGRVVGSSVSMTGHGGYGLHYDESLGGSASTIVIVK